MKFRRLAASVAAVTALSGLSIAAAPANAAAPMPALSLGTSDITVHTANGTRWGFGLDVTRGSALTLHITRTVPRGTESHYWDVNVPSSSLTFNRSTQRGAFKTPQSTSPLTAVNLAFKATGHRNMPCSSGSETDYTGNLSGRASLITHLKGGGTVGGNQLVFKAGTTHLYVDNNCSPSFPTTNRCFTAADYNVTSPHQYTLFGFNGGGTQPMQLSHMVTLARPRAAARTDYVSSRSSTAPILNKTTKTLKVSGSASGLVTGSGKIVGKSLSHFTHACTLNGKHHTEEYYSAGTAKFTNTTGHAIVGRTSLTGRLTIANGASASFDYDTWH